jgi:hypothetical protein
VPSAAVDLDTEHLAGSGLIRSLVTYRAPSLPTVMAPDRAVGLGADHREQAVVVDLEDPKPAVLAESPVDERAEAVDLPSSASRDAALPPRGLYDSGQRPGLPRPG